METSVHFVSNAKFGTNRRLDDVQEGTNGTVHFTEQLVCTFHVHVGEKAVLVLECTRVNPLVADVSASRSDFFGAGRYENWHNVDQISAHVDTALWSSSDVLECIERETCCFRNTCKNFFWRISNAPNTVPEPWEIVVIFASAQEQEFLFKSYKRDKCFSHDPTASSSDSEYIVNQPRNEVVHDD